MVGMAETVIYPASFSLIADLYDPQRRFRMAFLFSCATQVISGVSSSLCGLLIGSVTWARSAAVGTRVELTVGFTWRKPSQEAKKKVLFLRMGPPNVAPY